MEVPASANLWTRSWSQSFRTCNHFSIVHRICPALTSRLNCRQYLGSHKVVVCCSARSGSTKSTGTTNLLLRAASEALLSTTTPSSPFFTECSFGGSGINTPFSGSLRLHYDCDTSGPHASNRKPSPTVSLASSRQNSRNGMDGGKHPSGTSPPFIATVEKIRHEHIAAAQKIVVNSASVLDQLEVDIHTDCDTLSAFLLAIQVRTASFACHVIRLAFSDADFLFSLSFGRSSAKYRHGRRTASSALEKSWHAGS